MRKRVPAKLCRPNHLEGDTETCSLHVMTASWEVCGLTRGYPMQTALPWHMKRSSYGARSYVTSPHAVHPRQLIRRQKPLKLFVQRSDTRGCEWAEFLIVLRAWNVTVSQQNVAGTLSKGSASWNKILLQYSLHQRVLCILAVFPRVLHSILNWYWVYGGIQSPWQLPRSCFKILMYGNVRTVLDEGENVTYWVESSSVCIST